jgi:hypothetical protein
MVPLIHPPYPSSIAGTLETVAAPCVAPVSLHMLGLALVPPLTPRPPCVSVVASSSRAFASEHSLVGTMIYHPVIMACDPCITHPMVTHFAVGVTKPVDRLQVSTTAAPSTLCLIPTGVVLWRSTRPYYPTTRGTLVPWPPKANMVIDKWIFMHKLKVDGSIDHYKSHWVLRGFTQCPRVDYDEIFSPVIKLATI